MTGFLSYIKQVCKEAVVDAGADWIHFDIVNQTPENFHPLAQQMFREWLKARYPTTERAGTFAVDALLGLCQGSHHADLYQSRPTTNPHEEYLIFKSHYWRICRGDVHLYSFAKTGSRRDWGPKV